MVQIFSLSRIYVESISFFSDYRWTRKHWTFSSLKWNDKVKRFINEANRIIIRLKMAHENFQVNRIKNCIFIYNFFRTFFSSILKPDINWIISRKIRLWWVKTRIIILTLKWGEYEKKKERINGLKKSYTNMYWKNKRFVYLFKKDQGTWSKLKAIYFRVIFNKNYINKIPFYIQGSYRIISLPPDGIMDTSKKN